MDDRSSLFLAFSSEAQAAAVAKRLHALNPNLTVYTRKRKLEAAERACERWRRRECSTFDYLMLLNTLGALGGAWVTLLGVCMGRGWVGLGLGGLVRVYSPLLFRGRGESRVSACLGSSSALTSDAVTGPARSQACLVGALSKRSSSTEGSGGGGERIECSCLCVVRQRSV
jgi:hypothetical protein